MSTKYIKHTYVWRRKGNFL